MPTKPEVQSASPFWMTATASAAVTILLRMTASRDGYWAVQPPSIGERLAADLRGRIRAQEDREGPELLRRDELVRGLLLGQQLELRLRDLDAFARGAASICFWTSGVSTQPGQMALQVTPVVAVSSASTLVRPTMPCFEAT